MAVTAATLTTTVSESVTLNGKTFGNSITKTHASVKVVREQIVTVPNGSEVALYNAADSGAGVTFDEDLIKYAEGLDRIHQQFKENTNKIFKQFEDRD